MEANSCKSHIEDKYLGFSVPPKCVVRFYFLMNYNDEVLNKTKRRVYLIIYLFIFFAHLLNTVVGNAFI